MRVLFSSDDMLNMNISISSMNVLNRVLKKFGESEEKWDKELNEYSDIAKNKSETIAIEFLNLTGVDLECWLDAQELDNNISNKNQYKTYLGSTDKNNAKKVHKSSLARYYQHLSEAQLKIKKDKFSFRIKGYVPVYSNVFSTNYTTSFRMKKDKIAKDEVNAIYSKMKKTKQEKKDKNKDTKDDLLLPKPNVEMRTNSEILTGLLADDEESLLEKNEDNNIINNNEIDTSSGMKESDKNNSDKIVLEDEIEILVKVRQEIADVQYSQFQIMA
jgi:hypothetical protein